MKPEYIREDLRITEFDAEDVITTSGVIDPTTPENVAYERENAYGTFGSFDKAPGLWF